MFVKILTAFTGKVNDNTPTCFYGTCAFTYLAAMLSSNKALLYVPYPTQVIGKSCKPIPVMILGVLVAKKRYPLRKYLFILLIILGVALFMYNDKSKSTLSTNYGFGWGEVLLLFSLAMDGLTGGIQDKYFIFMTVTEFGPLTCSIATTTRKFFTVLASVIFFQNPLTLRQWIGTVLVFLGLSLDSFYGKAPVKKEKASSETK
ncbi:Solute carrier family 35 member B1 [Trichinella pseudospiralis]|uniref:Solute carrier family 35 member B1 n=1 Tax=Trichinella pseudospiralis TaxID=6337 RepID=A0A0V0YGD5_TRIPS|nr:Solute carrier family 35 member B1 [Trichinella pseudospiralis]